ncbi:helix-turn-helix transcriptional regulator [Streptomyces sp. PanSC9]|uniref:helix-turn-helix domain-containing protein n=1 Tax=Streptomyces sp. PanSC9 TaxID=1520461 RepID=UPI000F466422|nr:helix-turn-helix transcriptional regulator [Streptomyces sp. PanSC9]ROP48054.1 putative transcriptional regulator [Streptomyces sp. PanSC9]ROP55995.1 putative transcriptional regulator [Streptomyces sp. PanSC9]
MPIAVDIDVMLARRKMSVGELAERVGITPANLAVLKNGRARAVRFTTLAALCEVLRCQPGDLLRWEAEDTADTAGPTDTAGPADTESAAGAAGGEDAADTAGTEEAAGAMGG